MLESSLFIDGRAVPASDGKCISNLNPATEELIGTVPVATSADIDAALDAAISAFGVWSHSAPDVRAETLIAAANSLKSKTDKISALLSLEQGKTLIEAKGEVGMSVAILQYYAEEARRLYGRIIPSSSADLELKVTREPIGPVAVFCPWNFPLVELVAHSAAALAAGCTVVAKVAEETPLVGIEVAKALTEAGLPAGAFNILTGDPAAISEQLISSTVIRKVALTGSVRVGRLIAAQAGKFLKPATMELGGNAPVIVFDDVDIKATASHLASRKTRNAGQVCTAPNRFFIHDSVYDSFVATYSEALASIRIGPASNEASEMGPLMHANRLATMIDFVEDARDNGSTIVQGGSRHMDCGYFFENTVIADVPSTAKLAHDEVFGPISSLWRFDDEGTVIRQANDTNVGLAGYVYSKDLDRARHIAAQLEVGTVAINHGTVMFNEAPFGGVKDTGYGRICGNEGIQAYLTSKLTSTMARSQIV